VFGVTNLGAVLRLVYGELGRDTFELENRDYRDAGRLLSKARDTVAVAGALEELARHVNKQLADPDLKALRNRLRRSKAEQHIDRKQILQVAEALSSARQRVETWPINSDGFPGLRAGLQRLYKRRRANLELTRVEPTTEDLHEWRKKVKYLWYQVCV